jgi:hypothetical protein
MNKKNMQKVVRLLNMKSKISNYDLSPNEIANLAYNNGIELTSQEVVYISDNYKIKNRCLTYCSK